MQTDGQVTKSKLKLT